MRFLTLLLFVVTLGGWVEAQQQMPSCAVSHLHQELFKMLSHVILELTSRILGDMSREKFEGAKSLRAYGHKLYMH